MLVSRYTQAVQVDRGRRVYLPEVFFFLDVVTRRTAIVRGRFLCENRAAGVKREENISRSVGRT